jgi:hypothetical protein
VTSGLIVPIRDAGYCASVSRYVRVPVGVLPQVAVDALRRELAARGITEYAVVDHGHDMARAGATVLGEELGEVADALTGVLRDLATSVRGER